MSYKSYSNLGVDASAPSPDSVIKVPEITSKQDRDQVISSYKVVVIDNFADWCGPCQYIAPHFAQLAKKYSQPKVCSFFKEDVEKRIPGAPIITGVPCFHFYVNGNYQRSLTVTGGDLDALNASLATALKSN